MSTHLSRSRLGRGLQWLAEAAERTRTLPGLTSAHHGAVPAPLPEPTRNP